MSRAVIDQPGIRTVLIGLALSIFLGLALSSQISDTRVQGYLNKSIDRMQKDFFVDYESAHIVLSNWGMPLPELVIRNIRLSPKANSCQNSQIYVDELEIPISLSMILGVSQSVPKIRLKQVELRLADIDKCLQDAAQRPDKTNRPLDGSVTTASATVKIVSQDKSSVAATSGPQKNIFNTETRAELKEITIERLKVILSRKPDQPLLFRQITADMSYSEHRLSELKIASKFNAIKDSRSDVYFLNSNFIGIFKAGVGNNIESTVNLEGKLLDGDAKVFLHSFSGSQKISYEIKFDQVSFKSVIPFIENQEIVGAVDKTPVSVGFNAQGEVLTLNGTSIDSHLQNILVNVENGSVKAKEISLKYENNKLSFSPFTINVSNLPLTKLKNLESFKRKLDSFESLGEFSGALNFSGVQSFSADGRLENIQTIFSNRGRRDLQKIDHIHFKFRQTPDEIEASADDFVIANEKTPGQMEILHNRHTLKTTGNLKLNSVLINPNVWEQFTYVEQSPRLDLTWSYKKDTNEQHEVRLHLDKLNMPGVELGQLNVDLTQVFSEQPQESHLSVAVKPTRIEAGADFFKNKTIDTVLNPNGNPRISRLSSNKTSLQLSGHDWRDIHFDMNSVFDTDVASRAGVRLNFKGQVRYQKGLSSILNLQNKYFQNIFKLTTDENGNDVKTEQLVLKHSNERNK